MSRYCSWIVIAAAILSGFFPSTFAWVQQGARPSIILGIIMLTMGCTLSTEDFKIVLSRPLDILLGTLAQFTVMPFVAYGLTKVFGLDPFLSAGIILVGCCPGGVSSNIMSFLCHGDVAFSVGMTTVSTLLAPIVTPLMVLWLAGQQIEVDAFGMFQNICLVTILPRMTFEETIETTKIHSIAGTLKKGSGLIATRPFRAPHQSSPSIPVSKRTV